MIMSTLHHRVPPERVGQAIALRLRVVYGSSLVMPPVFGVAGAALGAVAVFWIFGIAVGAGAWASRRLP